MNSKTILATTLALAFAASMIFANPVMADDDDDDGDNNRKKKFNKDPKDAAPDFDIRKYGIDKNGNPFVKVVGKICGTASNGLVIAYILVTDDGVFVIAAHGFLDDDEQAGPAPDLTCHAHKVTGFNEVTECVTSLSGTGETVALSNNGKLGKVIGTSATEVTAAISAIADVSTGEVCPVALDTA